MSKPKRPQSVLHGEVRISVIRGPREDGRWYWRAKRGRKVEPWPEALPRWLSADEARTAPMGFFTAVGIPQPPVPTPPPKRRRTVAQAVGRLLAHREAMPGRKPRTVRANRWAARKLIGTTKAPTPLASRPLAELTTLEIAQHLDGLQKRTGGPLSSHSRKQVLVLLQNAVKFGVGRGWWEPLRIDWPTIKPRTQQRTWAPPEEAIQLYLAWLQDNAPRGVWLASRIQAETGCRVGEVCGTRGEPGACWEDFDLEVGVWYLERSKTGRRKVVLPQGLVALLRSERLRAEVKSGPLIADRPTYDDGSTWVNRSSRAYVLATRNRRICPHDLRRAFLTRAVVAGVDLTTISAQTGCSEEYILRVYSHTSDERRRAAAERLALGSVGLREVG